MNTLPRLLHRLEQAAHDREKRAVRETVEQLARAGFGRDVDAALKHLPSRDAAFVRDVMRPNPTQGGPGMSPVNTMWPAAPVVASSNPLAGVTQDAASGIYCPASASEWAIVLAVAGIGSGGPSALWLLQESSGSPADSIGSFPLAVTGAVAYQQPISGWSRMAVAMADATSEMLGTTSASLPNIASTSLLTLAFAAITGAPAASRNAFTHGTTADAIAITTTPAAQAKSNTNAATGANALTANAVIPWVLRTDRTAGSCMAATLADKMVPTFSTAVTGQKITIGPTAASNNAPPLATLYCAAFFGSAAELTDAQVKTLLQTLGWSPTWS